MIQIVPAILAKTEAQYEEDLARVAGSGVSEDGWLHVDFADGRFVENETVGFEVLKKYPTKLNLEAHLMIEEPHTWVSGLKDAGVKRVIAHVETGQEVLDDFIEECKVLDVEVGLAVKMDTPLEKLESYWEVIDLVLVMSIVPGFQGQPFIPESLDRIREIAKLCKNYDKPFMIGIDGHVNAENMKQITEAGADHLVVGSYLLKGDFDENLEKLWEEINS